jgi:penicillin amidase
MGALDPVLTEIGERLNSIDEKLGKINARIKMGSYAWVVAGSKTASGNPIIYSGPQMGFSVPPIVNEGSIEAGDIHISGMNVAGIPGIIIGRTPHHAWSMQVGHAHTTDYYIEAPSAAALHRIETIRVAGQSDVSLPVYRTSHGPVVNPMPFDPAFTDPIVSWKYAHWGYEFASLEAYLMLARATSMDDFGAAIEKIAVSQHFCYADRDGNIAYWMSGRDPVRPDGEWRLPQGVPFVTEPPMEWDAAALIDRSHDRNAAKGFYGGWNNKAHPAYDNAYNSANDIYGPFQRAHVIYDYLETHDNLTFAEVRDLALNIATTDSFNGGGNPWPFVQADFEAAVAGSPTAEHQAAIDLLNAWDGHFVAGGPSQWVDGADRADAWMLLDRWLAACLRLTFQDEFAGAGLDYLGQNQNLLFNVFLHGLPLAATSIANNYDWFAPSTSSGIILDALDNALTALGTCPWGTDQRGEIPFVHEMIGDLHTTPFASRSTYAHCIELDTVGPARIESMFPLGQSGTILMGSGGAPVYDPHFFSMAPVFDGFSPRPFELLASTVFPGDSNFDDDLDGSDLAVYANVFGVPGNTPLFRVAGWFGHFRPQ